MEVMSDESLIRRVSDADRGSRAECRWAKLRKTCSDTRNIGRGLDEILGIELLAKARDLARHARRGKRRIEEAFLETAVERIGCGVSGRRQIGKRRFGRRRAGRQRRVDFTGDLYRNRAVVRHQLLPNFASASDASASTKRSVAVLAAANSSRESISIGGIAAVRQADVVFAGAEEAAVHVVDDVDTGIPSDG